MLKDKRPYSESGIFQCPECMTSKWRVYHHQDDWQCVYCTDNTPTKNLRYTVEYLRGFWNGYKKGLKSA